MADILIIDDDPEIRLILTKYLNEINHMPMVVETISIFNTWNFEFVM